VTTCRPCTRSGPPTPTLLPSLSTCRPCAPSHLKHLLCCREGEKEEEEEEAEEEEEEEEEKLMKSVIENKK
jgi:hypothetical protein